MSKYYIEIDCQNIECTGLEHRGWVGYDSLVSEGDTLEECLENAVVFLTNQDGGEAGEVEADSDEFQALIEQEFRRITSLQYKIEQLVKKLKKPFKRMSYYDTWSGKKPNIFQKLVYKHKV